MTNELQNGFSPTHLEWFDYLWNAHTSTSRPHDLEGTPESEPDTDQLFSAFLLERGKKKIAKGTEKNIRTHFSQLTRDYLAIERYREDSLTMEKDALFSIARSHQPSAYTFYRKKFLAELKETPKRDGTYFRAFHHFLAIDKEFQMRNLGRLDSSFVPFSSEYFLQTGHLAWATTIAETSLNQLVQLKLSPLQITAYERLLQHQGSEKTNVPDFWSVPPSPSSAQVLGFLYRWFIKPEEVSFLDLPSMIEKFSETCTDLNRDLAINILYTFHNILATFDRNRLLHLEISEEAFYQLWARPYEIGLDHQLLAELPIDMFILMRIYTIQVDLMWNQDTLEPEDKLFQEKVAVHLTRVSTYIEKHIHTLPEAVREVAKLHLDFALAFYRHDLPAFVKMKPQIAFGKLKLDVFGHLSEWQLLKMDFLYMQPATAQDLVLKNKLVDEPINLSNSFRAFSKKISEKSEGSSHSQYLNNLGNAALLIAKFLRAKRPQTKQKVIQEFEQDQNLPDRHWILFHLRAKL